MELEQIKKIIKDYEDLEIYVEKICQDLAEARGIYFYTLERFEISGDQVECYYKERSSCGCCGADYDYLYFDIELLTEDPSVVVERLKEEKRIADKLREEKAEAERQKRAARELAEQKAQYEKLKALFEK